MPTLSPKRRDALAAIAKLIAPKAKRAVVEVTAAATDGAAYYRAHETQLAERNIDGPMPLLPWIALVDALIAAKACTEIDWKTDADEVAWAIGKLPGAPRKALAAIAREDDDRSTWELLELAGQLLRGHDRQLCALDIDSDSYCLVLVPLGDARTLVALAKGVGEVNLFGDDLAAATKERIEFERRDAAARKREAARQARLPKPKIEHFAKGSTSWWFAAAGNDLQAASASPASKFSVTHTYSAKGDVAMAMRARIAELEADGFRAITQEVWETMPRAKEGYAGHFAPFPAKARYFLDNGRVVRCLAQQGAAVWSGGGVVGASFGNIQDVKHYANEKTAARELAAEATRYAAIYKEVTRAEIAARYAKKRK